MRALHFWHARNTHYQYKWHKNLGGDYNFCSSVVSEGCCVEQPMDCARLQSFCWLLSWQRTCTELETTFFLRPLPPHLILSAALRNSTKHLMGMWKQRWLFVITDNGRFNSHKQLHGTVTVVQAGLSELIFYVLGMSMIWNLPKA